MVWNTQMTGTKEVGIFPNEAKKESAFVVTGEFLFDEQNPPLRECWISYVGW